jgi:hypothetical protein
MKKTLISIAVASVFASGAALACNGPSCGSIASGTMAATGVSVSASGNGFAEMGSQAAATNSTGASVDYGRGASLNTEAYSFGATTAASYGNVAGNADGVTFGLAAQGGVANAGASEWNGWYRCPYNGTWESVSAGSHAGQASAAGTIVTGNGVAYMNSGAGAWNKSSAKADADQYSFGGRLLPRVDVWDTDASAATGGGTYSYGEGFVLGQAAGAAGGIAGQSGSARAEGNIETGRYHRNTQLANSTVNASTESGSAAGVAGIGLFAGVAESSSLAGAGGVADADIVSGFCNITSHGLSAVDGVAASYKHADKVGFGVAGAAAGADADATAIGATLVNGGYNAY